MLINMPTFIMTTPDNIVDDLGVIDRQIKELEAASRKLKAALTEAGPGQYNGKYFSAEVQEYYRNNISGILVKEYGTKDFVAQVTQIQHIKSVVVKQIV
jgi:hypothetical protein